VQGHPYVYELYTNDDYRVAENTVHHSAGHPTYVDLPVRSLG
jgi:hypothetical protein